MVVVRILQAFVQTANNDRLIRTTDTETYQWTDRFQIITLITI